MPKYISGRTKLRDPGKLTADRYRYLGLDQAEPNLGDPPDGTPPTGAIPSGERYQIVSVEGHPGERYWIPVEGGIIPGVFTIYDEGTLVGGINSTSQLNFVGAAISASSINTFKETTLTLADSLTFSFTQGLGVTQKNSDAFGYVKESTTNSGIVTITNVTGSFTTNAADELFEDSVGIARTPVSKSAVINASVASSITVSPEFFSENKQLTYNDNGEFNGAGVYWDKANTRLGINDTTPAYTLDVDGIINASGSIRVGNTIYDSDGDPGSQGNILVKGAGNPGTIDWVRQESIISGAGGTIGNIQFHGTTGLVSGEDELNFNPYNEFIGIGTNDPAQKFQVGLDGKRYTTKKLTLDSAIGANYSAGDLVQLRTAASPFELQDIFGTLVYDVPSAGTALTVRTSNYETKGTQWSSFTGSGYRIFFNNTLLATGRYITSVGNDATIPETTYAGDDVFVVTSTGDVGIGTANPRIKRDSTTVNLDVAGDVLFKGDNNYDLHWDKSADSLILDDNAKFAAGTDSDLEIYHTGATGYIDNKTGHFYIRNSGSNDNSNIYIQARDGENSIICEDDASVKLYWGGAAAGLRAYTDSSGFRIDGRLYVDHGTSEFHGSVRFDGATTGRDIYFDESDNSLYAYDNAEFRVGTNGDVKIYHDTSNTYIEPASNGVGDLIVGSATTDIAKFVYNGGVSLYYQDVLKFDTIGAGVTVYGTAILPQINTVGIATIDNIQIGHSDDNTINTSTGNLHLDSADGTVEVEDVLYVDDTTSSTNATSGALVVSGGAGIAGDLNVGGGVTTGGRLKVNTHVDINSGFGTFIASVGAATTIDEFNVTTSGFKTAEYTLHFEQTGRIHSQKVLVMIGGTTTTYSQEFAIMYHPDRMVSFDSTISAGICTLFATPQSSMTGLTTFRFSRSSLL